MLEKRSSTHKGSAERSDIQGRCGSCQCAEIIGQLPPPLEGIRQRKTLANFENIKTKARNAVNVLGYSLAPWISTASGIVPNMRNVRAGWEKAIEGFKEVVEDAENLMIPDWQGYAAESYRKKVRERVAAVERAAALSKQAKDAVESLSLIQSAITRSIHETFQSFFHEIDSATKTPIKDFSKASEGEIWGKYFYVRTLTVYDAATPINKHLLNLKNGMDWREAAKQLSEELTKATQKTQAGVTITPTQLGSTGYKVTVTQDFVCELHQGDNQKIQR